MLDLEVYEYLCLSTVGLMVAYGFYRLGLYRGNKEVIRVFDQILIRIYHLVVSGKEGELHGFLSDLCGKQLDCKLDHKLVDDNSMKKGYKQ